LLWCLTSGNSPGNYITFVRASSWNGAVTIVAAIKLIIFLESLLLGGIVLHRAPRDGTSLLFAMYCFFIALSSLVEFQLIVADTPSLFLFWKQFDTFMYFATITMFHFALRIYGWKGARSMVFNLLLYGSFIMVAVIEGFILRPVSVVDGTWGFRSVYGETALNLHAVFVMVTGILAVALALLLFICMKNAREKKAKNTTRHPFYHLRDSGGVRGCR
jgi:hypothetical protein